jgi:DNA-binding response OmpR family regulator
VARVLLALIDLEVDASAVAALKRAGHTFRRVQSAREVRAELDLAEPEAILLDVELRDGSGVDLCAEIRRSRRTPIVFLTGRTLLADKVRCFRAGADDFLSAPFEPAELALRLDAILRRAAWAVDTTNVVKVGDLEVDPVARVVRRDGQPLKLSEMELEILVALASTPGQPWSIDRLARRLGLTADSYAVISEVMRMKVSRLRRKIEPRPRRPLYLHNRRKTGYLLAFNQTEQT